MRISGATVATMAAALISYGCGSDTSHSKRGVIPVVAHPKAPATYTLEDPECLKGTETVALTKTEIQAWDGDQVVARSVPLTGVETGDSLTSKVVKMTTWNDHFERVCDLDRGVDHACDDVEDGGEKEWYLNQNESGGFLRVCKDDHAYGRESYEGVALTSLSYIERANTRYMQLAEPSQPLDKIVLSVLPHFIDYYDNYIHERQLKRLKKWITHNLAYFQGGMIAVFPENVVDREQAAGYFWESEFVLGHEFGHHIEWERHGSALRAAGFEWNALTHSVDDLLAVRVGQNATSARGKLVGAVSEAYADMLAYYSEGATARSLVGLPELGIDRNVDGASFANGDAKILTEDRLELLLAGTIPEDANETRYTEIHIVGAIFAHALDEVFKMLALTDVRVVPGSDVDLGRRYQLTLAWMDALVQELPKSEATGTDVITPLGLALETAVQGYLTKFPLTGGESPTTAEVKREVCKQVATSLPAMGQVPFAASSGRCE